MPPDFAALGHVERLDRLFRRLMRRETGPVVPAVTMRRLGLVQVMLCLSKPVP